MHKLLSNKPRDKTLQLHTFVVIQEAYLFTWDSLNFWHIAPVCFTILSFSFDKGFFSSRQHQHATLSLHPLTNVLRMEMLRVIMPGYWMNWIRMFWSLCLTVLFMKRPNGGTSSGRIVHILPVGVQRLGDFMAGSRETLLWNLSCLHWNFYCKLALFHIISSIILNINFYMI